MTEPSAPELLTQTQVCARLGISDATWWRWRTAKRTPDAVVLPSGRLKWRREDIDRLAGAVVEDPLPARRRYFQSAYAAKRSA